VSRPPNPVLLRAPRGRGDTERISPGSPGAAAWHKPIFISFLLVWLVNWLVAAFAITLPADGLWVEGLLPIAAVATTLVGLRRTLPLQNVLAIAVLIAGFAYVVTALCVRTGLPFGPIAFLDADANPLLGTVPWWIPALWLVVMVNARGVARLVLHRWRTSRNYGLWVIGVTCALVVVFDLGLEPFAIHTRYYWLWTAGKSPWGGDWYGAPLSNFLAWLICTLLLAIATFVWSINKRPVPVVPDYHPLAIWFLLTAWMTTGNLVQGRWVAATCSMVSCLVMVALLLWSAKSAPLRVRTLANPSFGGRDPRTKD
jgi:uncharacterized membrane protein